MRVSCPNRAAAIRPLATAHRTPTSRTPVHFCRASARARALARRRRSARRRARAMPWWRTPFPTPRLRQTCGTCCAAREHSKQARARGRSCATTGVARLPHLQVLAPRTRTRSRASSTTCPTTSLACSTARAAARCTQLRCRPRRHPRRLLRRPHRRRRHRTQARRLPRLRPHPRRRLPRPRHRHRRPARSQRRQGSAMASRTLASRTREPRCKASAPVPALVRPSSSARRTWRATRSSRTRFRIRRLRH
jgi:hypothetical protein